MSALEHEIYRCDDCGVVCDVDAGDKVYLVFWPGGSKVLCDGCHTDMHEETDDDDFDSDRYGCGFPSRG